MERMHGLHDVARGAMAQQSIAPLNDRDLVLCDFDGTISAEYTGLLVARELRLERFFEIEDRWRRGEISSRECLRDQWLTVDPSRDDFRELIANLEVSPGFQELVALAEARGARFVILSDGLDYYIRMTLERMGLVHL